MHTLDSQLTQEMGTRQSSTHVANDTDEDLEVRVEFAGNSCVHLVRAHDSVNVPTVFTPPIESFYVFVEILIPSAVATGQWHWIKRAVHRNSCVLIRKRETKYVLYQSKKEEIWEIDRNEEVNR